MTSLPNSSLDRLESDENKWASSAPCAVCGKPYNKHAFRHALTCIMAGTETKDGDEWTQADSDAVVERVVRRLS